MNGKRKKLRMAITCLAVCMAVLFTGMPVQAAEQLKATPYASIEYQQTDSVSTGTLRYISQVRYALKFQEKYWGKWAGSAKRECGTACISMALSYVGVNKTPEEILNYGNGTTYFGAGWGGTTYSTLSFEAAFERYVNGGGRYSPPIIHLKNYSSGGHFVLVVAKVSENTYQVADPWSTTGTTWNITIKGTTATYKKIITKTDTVTAARQYYNANAKLVLEKPVVKKLQNPSTGKLKVTWTQNPLVTGYQIQYATSSDMSGAKKVTAAGAAKTSRTISSLKKKKTYYVRIRTYKKTSYGTVYSKWSAKKKLKIS